ncbi:hypothetical protein V6N13_077358 [Hibiscus sabdariffa]
MYAANIEPCCIPRVPYHLRVQEEAAAYEPDVISIGPYHHGKPHLAAMEVEKQRCFWEIAKETKLEMDEFRSAMRPLAHEARMCYHQMIVFFEMEFAEFVDMMVLDGCFIVQLICCKVPDAGEIEELAMLVLSFFELSHRPLTGTEFIHLLDLVHSTYLPSPEGIQQYKKYKLNSQCHPRSSIPCATELEYAGIGFYGDDVEKMKKDEYMVSLGVYELEMGWYLMVMFA